MKGYYIQNIEDPEKGKYNAHQKAPADINTILQREGYSPIVIKKHERWSEKFRTLYFWYTLLFVYLTLPRNSVLIIQYPHNNFAAKWLWILRKKNIKLVAIIHDLDGIRYSQRLSLVEKNFLQRFDYIVAHTPAMRQLLIEHQISPEKIRLLNAFDYLIENTPPPPPMCHYGLNDNIMKTICYAGNLDKSLFVKRLPEITRSGSLCFNLYGAVSELIWYKNSRNIVYKGKFLPNNPSIIEGGWGLVWDGDDIECCTGNFGEYLRWNSSHKLSLYIACGMPVIVWRQAAVAQWVERHQLGIVVDSLYEIETQINSMTIQRYNLVRDNVSRWASKLRDGEMIKGVLQDLNI